jgi:sugar phosphate isomerase/epimerase
VALATSPAQAWHKLPPGEQGWLESQHGAIRGVTVGPIESSQWPGRGYGSAASAELLDELVRLGANWISITPFGRVWSLRSTEIATDFEAPYAQNQADVARMIEQAHARGLKVLLIPHLWVERGGWRGEIDPGSAEGWQRYQTSYRAFVLGWAELAARAGADAFSIGVECKSWSSRFYPFWKSLIASVRSKFSGPLTYSANWDEAEQVAFWSELDLIGINAFYPLASHGSARYEEYLEGARRARDSVAKLANALEIPVVFVEVGYTTRRDAAVEPWLWPDDMRDVAYDEGEQARALAALLELFAPEPWFAGLFVWRYYASLDDVSQEDAWGFSPHAKQAERVLEQAFRWRWGSDPTVRY